MCTNEKPKYSSDDDEEEEEYHTDPMSEYEHQRQTQIDSLPAQQKPTKL